MSFREKGFTLIEVMVSISVISILFVGIFNLIQLSLQITNENKNYVEAIAVANEKMESIRNLPYDSVGTINGSPAGVVPEYATSSKTTVYNIHSTIVFFDDPYDGEIGTGDAVFTDYKIATIKVSWQTRKGAKDITVFSKIIPLTEETNPGYGLLKLQVVDANGAPVAGATIHVQKDTAPIVNVDYLTDANGYKSIPLLPAINLYQVVVSKTGYSSDQTYVATTSNPAPFKLPYTIIAGAKTEDSLKIDHLAAIRFTTVSNNTPENWQINQSSTASTRSQVDITADENDNMYFTWLQSTTSYSNIYIQKFNSSRVAQWPQGTRISTSSNFQLTPRLTGSKNGNTYITWSDNSLALKNITKISGDTEFASNLPSTTPSNAQSVTLKIDNNNNLHELITKLTSGLDSLAHLFSEKISLATAIIDNWLANRSQNHTNTATAFTSTIAFISSAGATTASVNSIVINKPASILTDDLLIAYIHNDDYNDGVITPPAGWSTLDNDMQPGCASRNDSRGSIFYKFAGGSEAATYTFTSPAGQNDRKSGQIRAYRNVNMTTTFDGTLQETHTNDGNLNRPAPSHTVSTDGSMLVTGWGSNTSTLGDSNPNFPAGMSNALNKFAQSATTIILDKSVNISDSPTGSKILDATQDVSQCSLGWSLVLKPSVIPDDVTVSALNNQNSQLIIPEATQYVGATLVFKENTSSRNITSVKLSEFGTVNAQTGLANVKAYYDFDTSLPFDCASESYNAGVDSQFGSTGTFNGADGTITFTPGAPIGVTTSKTLCLYVVSDITSSAASGNTLELKINNPMTDVTVSSGNVGPSTSLDLPGTTNLLLQTNLQQAHYRLRKDDGSEQLASWAANQDSPATFSNSVNTRIRLEVSNEGDITGTSSTFQLEFGEKTTSCSAVTTWLKVPNDNSTQWRMGLSPHISDLGTTSNMSNGLTDENPNFVTGVTLESTNPAPTITLSKTQFTELEFSIIPTASVEDKTYCFRLTNNGTTTYMSYLFYPEISLIGDSNIYLKSLDSDGNERWSIKRPNTDNSSAEQTNPNIATTENFGSATTTVVWSDYRNGQSDIYAESFSDNGTKLWADNLQITSSSTVEDSVTIAFDKQDDNFVVAWINNGTTSKELYFQKFDLEKNSLWSAPIRASASLADQINPTLTIDNSDNLYLSWQTTQDSHKIVVLAKFNASGTPLWQGVVNKGNFTGNLSSPNIVATGSHVYPVWTDDRDGNNDIYSQKIDSSGNLIWTDDQRLNVNLGSSDQVNSVNYMTSSGLLISAWEDNRSGSASSTIYDIYATIYSDPETITPAANLPLIIKGDKTIGPNVLKYNEKHTTNAIGELDLTLEWDPLGYSATIDTSQSPKTIYFSIPTMPIRILPTEFKTVELFTK